MTATPGQGRTPQQARGSTPLGTARAPPDRRNVHGACEVRRQVLQAVDRPVLGKSAGQHGGALFGLAPIDTTQGCLLALTGHAVVVTKLRIETGQIGIAAASGSSAALDGSTMLTHVPRGGGDGRDSVGSASQFAVLACVFGKIVASSVDEADERAVELLEAVRDLHPAQIAGVLTAPGAGSSGISSLISYPGFPSFREVDWLRTLVHRMSNMWTLAEDFAVEDGSEGHRVLITPA